MFDVITIGGATRDVFFVTNEGTIIESKAPKTKKRFLAFEYGSKIIPEKAEFAYGGGGANSAISFSKFGLKTATVLRIGAEGTGSLIIKELERAGVSCDYVHRDKINHTALSIIVSVPGRDHTMFLYRGSNDFLEISDWRMLKTKWLYLSSLTGNSINLIPELFSYARAHGIKVAWNPGSEQLKEGYSDLSSYLEETDILLLNRDEAVRLVLSKNRKANILDEKELLSELVAMTGGLVVITDGPNGSYASDGKIDYFETADGDKAVETTGAGDAYCSIFVGSQISGFTIKESMKLAAANAASVVKYIGAQKGLMTFDELRATIKTGVRNEIS